MDVNKFLVIMVTKPKSSSPTPDATPAAESMDTCAPATTTATTTTSTATVRIDTL